MEGGRAQHSRFSQRLRRMYGRRERERERKRGEVEHKRERGTPTGVPSMCTWWSQRLLCVCAHRGLQVSVDEIVNHLPSKKQSFIVPRRLLHKQARLCVLNMCLSYVRSATRESAFSTISSELSERHTRATWHKSSNVLLMHTSTQYIVWSTTRTYKVVNIQYSLLLWVVISSTIVLLLLNVQVSG